MRLGELWIEGRRGEGLWLMEAWMDGSEGVAARPMEAWRDGNVFGDDERQGSE